MTATARAPRAPRAPATLGARTRTPRRPPVSAEGGAAMVALAGTAYIAAFAAALSSPGSDVWGALIATVAIVAISGPIVRAMFGEGARAVRTLMLSALVLKCAGALVQYAIAFELYDGSVDASRYHRAGMQLAEAFRLRDFDLGDSSLVGTRFIEILTGIIYALFGSSRIVGYLVFSWIGFLGVAWFYKAFRLAVPEGQHKLYGYLILLLPSMLFWPSSIGKEAWMMGTLGLATYGAARYLTHQRGALIRLGLGLWGASMVRPHVVLLLLAGIAVAVVFRPRETDTRGLSHAFQPILRVVVVVAIAIGFVVTMGRSEERFNVGEERGAESLVGARDFANERSTRGTSTFEAQPVRSPLDFPGGFVSVLFRPFLWEARSGQMFVSAIEGSMLLGLLLWRWRSTWETVKRWRTLPYVGLSLVFIVGFVWGFSSFGNFGLLVRQRVQVYPYVLALLSCAPRIARPSRPRRPVGRQGRATATRARPARQRPGRPGRPVTAPVPVGPGG